MTGHTAIENSYVEWLTSKAELTSLDLRILLFVFRKTAGWGKEKDRISFGQFQKATNCSRPAVMQSLYRLERTGCLGIERAGKGKINTYKLVNYTYTTSKLELTRTSKAQLTNKINKETKQKAFIKKFRKNGTPYYEMS